jgi:hypothetical protein
MGVVTFGITSFGSVTELATRMALEKLGVNSSQITIVQTGGSLTGMPRYRGIDSGHSDVRASGDMAVRTLGMNLLH